MHFRINLLLWASFVVTGTVACGPPAPKEQPQIFLDRTKLGFNQEFNSGTFIGTSIPNTVKVTNKGIEDLIISGVTLSGAQFFKQGPDTTTVAFNKNAIIEVDFTPLAAKLYSGTLTINTNAENTPSVVVELSGCGVNPANVDLSYCEKSTDF